MYGRIGQALLEAKQSGGDPFAAIEAVMPWDTFAASVTEAQKLAQPESFDFLHRIGESYATLRRYAPQFLDVLKLRAAPAAKGVLDAIDVLRGMNSDSARKVPANAPTADSDEAGHAFQYEAGHLFRSEAGQRSDLKPATCSLPPQVRIDDVALFLIGQEWMDFGRTSASCAGSRRPDRSDRHCG